jgi:osmotically-inducible protein OsmY
MNLFNLKQVNKFLSVFMIVMAMFAVSACHSTNDKESAGEYIDDSVITTKVKAALVHDKTVKAAEVNVETFKGVVQLSGFVSEAEDAAKAVKIAREVKGVVSVKNDIRVK